MKTVCTCWCFLIMNIHFPLNSHCGHLNLSSATPLPLSRRSSPCSSIPSSPNSPEVMNNKFQNFQKPGRSFIIITVARFTNEAAMYLLFFYDKDVPLLLTFKICAIHVPFDVYTNFKFLITGHPSKLLEYNEIAQLVGKEN